MQELTSCLEMRSAALLKHTNLQEQHEFLSGFLQRAASFQHKAFLLRRGYEGGGAAAIGKHSEPDHILGTGPTAVVRIGPALWTGRAGALVGAGHYHHCAGGRSLSPLLIARLLPARWR